MFSRSLKLLFQSLFKMFKWRKSNLKGLVGVDSCALTRK